MMRARRSESGFTLVEVLVALVVTSFLLAIVMDAMAGAKTRGQKDSLKQEALLLSKSLIRTMETAPSYQMKMSGQSGKLIWQLSENEMARDPRKRFVLTEASAQVGTEKNPNIITLQKRYLKKVKQQ